MGVPSAHEDAKRYIRAPGTPGQVCGTQRSICERVAEVQALLDDHLAGKHTAADVIAKAQAVLSEAELLRAMFDVGYFPPYTPPDE
jgi:hypothetical protein